MTSYFTPFSSALLTINKYMLTGYSFLFIGESLFKEIPLQKLSGKIALSFIFWEKHYTDIETIRFPV